ncbi:MAG: hypothetical protein A2017_01990 [Lentisphaerae bacterium GWF2_44_16]|nr:MAG: hypothetical protein A2017_01990 [Lentisphaerae bacterium GWF2_44_16]
MKMSISKYGKACKAAVCGKMDFTIVELLVVVSIIIILISMLMPALNKTREKAREINCSSNLKQTGNALSFYVNDFGDCLGRTYEVETSQTWSHKIIELDYLKKIPGDKMLGNSPLLCPKGARNSYNWPKNQALPDEYATSYALNACVTGYSMSSVFYYIRLSRLVRPSTNIMLAESSTYWCYFYNSTYPKMQERHSGRMNILFCDFHVGNARRLDTGTGDAGISNDLFSKWWGNLEYKKWY